MTGYVNPAHRGRRCRPAFRLLAATGLLLAACGGRERPPQLAAVADAPALRPGSTWTYRVEDSSESAPRMLTLTFQREDMYKGYPALVFAVGSDTLIYDRNLNFVARFANERIRREASPSYRSFDFPFYVDKEWHAVFTFQDHDRTLSWAPVEVYWKVKEYDRITVPAGEFRAFRLVSEPITNWGVEEEVWYAPEVMLPVKWKHKRTAAHYLGKGRQTAELVEYRLK